MELGERRGAACRATEFVALERRSRSAVAVVAPGVRVQLAITEKFEKRNMKRVGTGARRYVDYTSSSPAVLGGQRIGDDGELLDAVHDGRVAELKNDRVVLGKDDGGSVDDDITGGVPAAANPSSGPARRDHP